MAVPPRHSRELWNHPHRGEVHSGVLGQASSRGQSAGVETGKDLALLIKDGRGVATCNISGQLEKLSW